MSRRASNASPPPARMLGLALMALAALGLVACSMADSAKLLETGTKGCHSDLGAYFLPRDLLHVEVRRTSESLVLPGETGAAAAAKRQKPEYEIALIEVRTLPDRSRGYCLDYLASRISHDYLEAKRINGVIHRISTSNRAYSDDGPSWAREASEAIDTEDVTSEVLAKKLIDESFRKFNPDTWDKVDNKPVTQPWLDRETAKVRKGDDEPQGLFCDEQARPAEPGQPAPRPPSKKGGARSTDVAIDRKIDSELCLTRPTTNPGEAPLRPYFTEKPAAARRGETGTIRQNEVRTAQLQKAMRRTVFLGPSNGGNAGALDSYVPSGVRQGNDGELGKEIKRYQHSKLWQTDTAFSADFDPGRPAEAAVNNSGLRDFGYCILLNDGIVDLKDRDAYCDDPIAYAGHKGWRQHGADRFEGYVTHQEGILYRPRLNYTLYVFKKKDRKLPGGWRLEAQHVVSLANLSPMISVGVKRTLFASRNTIVEFDRGALVNIAVKKDSELLYGLDVPLALVKRIGELPTNIVKLRIRNTDAQKEDLLKVQQDLLKAEREHNEALARLTALRKGQTPLPGGTVVPGGGALPGTPTTDQLNVPTTPGKPQ